MQQNLILAIGIALSSITKVNKAKVIKRNLPECTHRYGRGLPNKFVQVGGNELKNKKNQNQIFRF